MVAKPAHNTCPSCQRCYKTENTRRTVSGDCFSINLQSQKICLTGDFWKIITSDQDIGNTKDKSLMLTTRHADEVTPYYVHRHEPQQTWILGVYIYISSFRTDSLWLPQRDFHSSFRSWPQFIPWFLLTALNIYFIWACIFSKRKNSKHELCIITIGWFYSAIHSIQTLWGLMMPKAESQNLLVQILIPALPFPISWAYQLCSYYFPI